MVHRSSNITILLLPAVTNCETNSKTTRQRQWKSQSLLLLCTTIFSEIKRIQSVDQWNPLHPTDLGLILIGIDQLHGVEQTDHQEVFHPRFEGLLAVLFLHQMASNGPTVLASNGPTVLASNGSTVLASNGPSVLAPNGPSILHHQLLAMMHIQFQETILLNHQALKACLTHPNETCLLCTTT